MAAVLMLSSDFEALVNYFLVASWVFYFMAAACVPYLRWREPDLPRPFRSDFACKNIACDKSQDNPGIMSKLCL